MTDLAARLVRRRWLVLTVWAVGAAVLLPRAAGVERVLEVAARVRGSESEAVEQELAHRFGTPYAQYAVLVLSGGPSPATPRGRALHDTLAATLRRVPDVIRVRPYETEQDTLLLARNGAATFVVVGLDPAAGRPDAIVGRLRDATAGIRWATARWTGQTMLNADLRAVSAADARRAERRVLPLALVLLGLAFGAAVAATLPLLGGTLTIGLALGAAALIGTQWPLSVLLQTFVSMIGLGLGIDYALLVVSRFREALATGRSAADAAAETARHAAHTIGVSGLAVGIGFAGLAAVPVNELRSLTLGGLLAVGFGVLFATTLLPCLLAWLGRNVDRGRLRPRASPVAAGARWRAWGRWVSRHPALVLIAAGLPVAALGWHARRMATGVPRDDWLPATMESAVAWRDLERLGRGGVLQTVRVVLELPAGHDVLAPAGWAASRRVHAWLAADPRVSAVRSIVDGEGARPLSRLAFYGMAEVDRRGMVAPDRRAVLLEAVPSDRLAPQDVIELVRDVRRLDAERVAGVAGARIRVGGLPAFRADYLDAVGGQFRRVVALVAGGTLLALAIGFRSLLVPVKAVALNLLAVSAGFGAVVLVFQDGHGAALLGLAGPVDRVFATIPTLVFCTVFGLSMDYEIFLVARVAEARRTMGEAEAIAEGLARTGPVITSAAAIMIVVFGAFALGDFLVMRMLGLALAVTVLIDATVIRIAIGPALLALAGRWNWWPGDRR